MPEINDIVAEALSAQPVVDEEQKEQYVQTALGFVRSRDSFAFESVTVDPIESKAAESTTVWNDEVKRTEITDQPMGGTTEIIIPDDSEYIFVGTEMPPMMGGLAGVENKDHDQIYMCLDDDSLSQLTNQSSPDGRDEKVEVLRVIRQGKVSINGDTVFFELDVDTDEIQWMESDTYKEDVHSEGIHSIVTFDLSEGELDHWFETIENAEQPNTVVLKEFLYNQSFDFRVPDKEDDDVVEADGMGIGGSGGLGSAVAEGGIGDVLGDSDDSLEDLIGNLTQGSENPFEDNGLF